MINNHFMSVFVCKSAKADRVITIYSVTNHAIELTFAIVAFGYGFKINITAFQHEYM